MAVFSASKISFFKLLELVSEAFEKTNLVVLDTVYPLLILHHLLHAMEPLIPYTAETLSLLTITCVGLHYNSFETSERYGLMLSTGTFCGFLIILIGVYAGYLFSMPISRRIDAFYSVCGCALFIASGALAIDHFQHVKFDQERKDIGLAKGSLAVINGLAFLVDAFVSWKSD